MTLKRLFVGIFFFISLSLIFSGCAGSVKSSRGIQPGLTGPGGGFPGESYTKVLEKTLPSVVHLNMVIFYNVYDFSRDQKIRQGTLHREGLENLGGLKTVLNKPSSGTATVVYTDPNRFALLTPAHVVDFPDTLILQYRDEFGRKLDFIRRVMVKSRQELYLTTFPFVNRLKILVVDSKNDLAIVGQELAQSAEKFQILPAAAGKSVDLKWGAFAYLIGYPKGFKMVTHALISRRRPGYTNSFLLDAPFNRGFSGGIVLAARDGGRRLVWIGVANSSAAELEYTLTPEKSWPLLEETVSTPYAGPVYATPTQRIDYGVTFGISIDTIAKFVSDNRGRLADQGYAWKNFFKFSPLPTGE